MMKTRFKFFALGLSGLLAGSASAKGELISSVNIDQQLQATDPINSGVDYNISASSTTLPFVRSLTLTTPYKANITANYNFSQTANSASFLITSVGSLVTGGQGVGEETYNGVNGLIFSITQTTTFSFSFTSTKTIGTESSEFCIFQDRNSGVELVSMATSNTAPITTSGTLTGGDSYYINEHWVVSNTQLGDASTGGGTDSFSLTLTAVPEPSSLCLLGGIAGIATRRRHRHH
jgi:hypothetical protein